MKTTGNYWELVYHTAVQGDYGFHEESGVWFLWRKANKYEYDIAVKVEGGEVVDANTWTTNQVNQFLLECPVEIREDAPDDVLRAAMDPPIEELV